jgi:peptidoglycan/xylan/chitin deacetylase (PgdA/CDA1 family)
LKIIALVIFYSRLSAWINHFVNGHQPKTDSDGKLLFPFVKKRQSRNVQILVYHRVNDEHDSFFPATPTGVFAKQMDYLASNFNVLSLEDAVERMRINDIPDSAVVITFDDGYKDNYLNAFPILKRLSISATIFLTTEIIGSEKVIWHDRVFSAFRETKSPYLKGFVNTSRRVPLETIRDKLNAQREVLDFLRTLDDRERMIWIDKLIEHLNVKDGGETQGIMLTWEEITIMHQKGISVGSHTVTHPILSKLPIDRARVEISESKKIIEKKLDTKIKAFAYPSGRREDFDATTKDLLREAGYECALTMIFGPNENGQDLFELRRGTPWEEDLPTFAMKLNWYKFRF